MTKYEQYISDIQYFQKKLRHASPAQKKRVQRQLDLMNDSLAVYRLTTPNHLRK